MLSGNGRRWALESETDDAAQFEDRMHMAVQDAESVAKSGAASAFHRDFDDDVGVGISSDDFGGTADDDNDGSSDGSDVFSRSDAGSGSDDGDGGNNKRHKHKQKKKKRQKKKQAKKQSQKREEKELQKKKKRADKAKQKQLKRSKRAKSKKKKKTKGDWADASGAEEGNQPTSQLPQGGVVATSLTTNKAFFDRVRVDSQKNATLFTRGSQVGGSTQAQPTLLAHITTHTQTHRHTDTLTHIHTHTYTHTHSHKSRVGDSTQTQPHITTSHSH